MTRDCGNRRHHKKEKGNGLDCTGATQSHTEYRGNTTSALLIIYAMVSLAVGLGSESRKKRQEIRGKQKASRPNQTGHSKTKQAQRKMGTRSS